MCRCSPAQQVWPQVPTNCCVSSRLEVQTLVGEYSSEDLVTCSLNAALAPWLAGEVLLHTSHIVAQGVCVSRDGQVYVQIGSNGALWVGGQIITVVSGSVLL